MKHLIIYSHPNPKSFCHAMLEAVTETLTAKGREVVVRDLYALNFEPVLNASDFEQFALGKIPADIKAEQDQIAQADIVTIIHPVWWSGMPAMLKGYIDRVFARGFAYDYDANGVIKLLTGKKVVIFNAQGTPAEIYTASGMFEAMKKTSEMGIYEFCGLEVLAHEFFAAVPFVDDAIRKTYLARVRKVMDRF